MALFIFLTVVESDEVCPCVDRRSCKTPPYGTHVLDIAVFGLFVPCKRHGDVRCCPREELGELFGSILQDGGSVDTGKECGCVPKGNCLLSLISTPSDCSELDELCCIPNADADAVFQLFKNKEDKLLDDIFNQDTLLFHSLPPQETVKEIVDEQLDYYILPCVPGLKCKRVYGFDPLDIANFGSLPHCSRRGFVRCVELKEFNMKPSSNILIPGDGEVITEEITDYGLPCMPVFKCHKIYGFDPLDIARFGALPQCTRPGFQRCTEMKEPTEMDIKMSPIVQYIKIRNNNKVQDK